MKTPNNKRKHELGELEAELGRQLHGRVRELRLVLQGSRLVLRGHARRTTPNSSCSTGSWRRLHYLSWPTKSKSPNRRTTNAWQDGLFWLDRRGKGARRE